MYAQKMILGMNFVYHFTCDYFHSDRKQFLKCYFYKKPNVMKFKELFSTKDTQTLINLAKYVDIIMKKFMTYIYMYVYSLVRDGVRCEG